MNPTGWLYRLISTLREGPDPRFGQGPGEIPGYAIVQALRAKENTSNG